MLFDMYDCTSLHCVYYGLSGNLCTSALSLVALFVAIYTLFRSEPKLTHSIHPKRNINRISLFHIWPKQNMRRISHFDRIISPNRNRTDYSVVSKRYKKLEKNNQVIATSLEKIPDRTLKRS
jgi:hypothetical protein